jgi:hypothetical protein
MKGRNKYYTLALALLIVIAAWFYFSNQKETFHNDEASFAMRDTSEISSFQILNNKSSLTISKQNNLWQFDRGYIANPALLGICFKVFLQVEIKSPVSKNEKSQIIENLRKYGTEIIISSDKKVLRDFYLWADTSSKSIFMIQKISEIPFLVCLPSYNGNFSAVFRPDKDFWRDRTILRYLPGQISKIKVEQPDNIAQSFELIISSNQKPEIKNLKNIKIQNINSDAVEAYLYCFKNVKIFKFLKKNDLQYQDLNNAQPDFIVSVTEINGKTHTLKTFKRKFQNIQVNKPVQNFDMNYCFVTLDNKETALARYIDIDPLTRDIEFFTKK